MVIKTIWVKDNSGEPPWLWGAWDEGTLEENPAGYEEDVVKAHKEYPHVRIIDVKIDGPTVAAAFAPVVMKGEILPGE